MRAGGEVVVEVENRGRGRGAAGDAADLLDDVAFECDWGGEERCLAGGAEVFRVLRAVGANAKPRVRPVISVGRGALQVQLLQLGSNQ